MKIQKKVATKAIVPIIFWPKCCLCGGRFGFEIGYKHPGGYPITTHFYYLCSSCGGNLGRADELFEEHTDRPKQSSKPMCRPIPQGSGIYKVREKDENNNYIKIIKETK